MPVSDLDGDVLQKACPNINPVWKDFASVVQPDGSIYCQNCGITVRGRDPEESLEAWNDE